jgi:hypothetical protein
VDTETVLAGAERALIGTLVARDGDSGSTDSWAEAAPCGCRSPARAGCRGTVVLRASDGVLLGRTRVDLRRGAGNITLRLTPAARRRLARNQGLPARAVVRFAPARRPIVHRSTLVRGGG